MVSLASTRRTPRGQPQAQTGIRAARKHPAHRDLQVGILLGTPYHRHNLPRVTRRQNGNGLDGISHATSRGQEGAKEPQFQKLDYYTYLK